MPSVLPGTGSDTLPTSGGTVRLPPHRDPQLDDPIVIEIEEEGESPRVVDWLGPAFEVTQPINDVPRASVQVITKSGLLVDDGGDLRDVLDILGDGVAIHIRTARATEDQDSSLFYGYVDKAKRSLLQQGKTVRLTLVGEPIRLNEIAAIAPQGQTWVQIDQERAWRDAGQLEPHNSVRPVNLRGMPCIFNPDGVKNRDADYVFLNDPLGGDGAENNPFAVPIFTHALDARRKSWAWRDVFLHLFWCARRQEDGTLGDWPRLIRDSNLWDALALGDQPYAGTLGIDVDALPSEPNGSPLMQVLLGIPRSHAIDGMMWLDAAKFTCAKAGLAFTFDRVRSDEDGWRYQLRFLAPGWVEGGIPPSDNKLKRAQLASPDYSTQDKTLAEIERDNNVMVADIDTSYAQTVNAVQVIGAAHRHEVTVELRPGWAYWAARTPQVDVIFGNSVAITAAEGQVGQAAWNERYHRKGAKFYEKDNLAVLRRWVVSDAEDMRYVRNAAGQFVFPRAWLPWMESAYAPLDLATLRLAEAQSPGGSSFVTGRSVRRPRPLKNCLTGLTRTTPFPPVVEVSGDSGVTWVALNGEVNVLRNRLGIWIGVEDLTTITAGAFNFAQLYIRGLLRVRVTGTIDGDEVIDENMETASIGASRRRRERLLLRPRDIRFTLRDDWQPEGAPYAFSGGNSKFRPTTTPSATPDVPDPTVASPADEHRGDYSLAPIFNALNRLDRVQHRGTIQMPRLRLPRHNENGVLLWGWRAGDELEGIRAEAGNDGDAHHLLLKSRELVNAWAIIAAVTWSYDPGDGRAAARATTTLTLEDPSMLAKLDMEAR